MQNAKASLEGGQSRQIQACITNLQEYFEDITAALDKRYSVAKIHLIFQAKKVHLIWFYTKDKGKRTTEHGIKSTEGKISFRDNYKEKPSKETFMLGKKKESIEAEQHM